MITERTRLIDVTVGDLMEYLRENMKPEQPIREPEPQEPERFVYGIKGLAELLGCSETTAQRQKSAGKFKGAVMQVGRKITVDVRKVHEIMRREAL